MKRLNFICTFESDIVLHASSNTEGKIEKLNCIPGSNFLGMVARNYAGFGVDAFDVFHSGEVCFGDGHIIVDGEPSYHMPFSFQAYKGKSFEDAQEKDELFVHHFLEATDFEEATAKGTQYKQQRVGFFTASGKYAKLEHSYKQKSAYDKKKRRSKDSTMFGYHALPRKSKWAFCVTLNDSMQKHEEKIKDLLIGTKRLGKSKSAEYGLVEIAFENSVETSENIVIEPQTINSNQNEKYLYLYAKSRLVLTAENGINSYTPSIESLGFNANDNVSIDWSKSQVRTSRYTPYVGARRNFDPERLVIDKGSVIVVEVIGEYNQGAFMQKIQKPIGLYISEGHGEVIVNPSWLLKKKVEFDNEKVKFADKKDSTNNQTKMIEQKKDLNNWLTTQRERKQKEATLLSEVFAFIEINNVKNKKSQWGQIRSLCRQSKDSDDLFDLLFSMDNVNGHPKGFLRHGKGLDKWNKSGNLIDNLAAEKANKNDDYKKFVTLLSIYAPKEDDKGGEDA